MKTVPRRFPVKMAQGIIVAGAMFLYLLSTRGDGIFVAPKFVWDKHRDINEPTQKAIIAYEAGYEAMVLQVKYEGPVEEFGWLIPVPSVPTVTQGSMECFYELSKYTQKHFEARRYAMHTMSAGRGIKGEDLPPEPPVKVIEIKTVGAYEVAVLSAKDAVALQKWLAENQFYIPADKGDVIDSYAKQGWCFVAVKINLAKSGGFQVVSAMSETGMNKKTIVQEKLSKGELHPLHLGFASSTRVFPLKISSINGKPSEVQVYLLSKEPLVEKGMFAKTLAEHSLWRTNTLARHDSFQKEILARHADSPASIMRRFSTEPDYHLSRAAMINDDELIPFGQVSKNELPLCSKEIVLPDKEKCWLTKQTWTFLPPEMHDLEFVPAIPVFADYLGDNEGYFVAAELAQLGDDGTAALLMAMQNTNRAVRAHAASALDRIARSPASDKVNKVLPTLLKDSDPEVRLHAAELAAEHGDPKYFDTAIELLRDKEPEINEAAITCLLSPWNGNDPNHISKFHEMLKDTNSTVQMAALRVMLTVGITPSREELLPLFKVPRMEVAAPAVAVLRDKGISCDEAKPLLQNSNGGVRMLGIAILARNETSDSVDLLIPLLKDQESFIQIRARDTLAELTGQEFPAEQPDSWEKWWSDNKSTFTVNSKEVEQRRRERRRERAALIRNQAESLPEKPKN